MAGPRRVLDDLDPARELERDGDGRLVMRIAVPFAAKDDVSLKQVGDELVVSAGREKRTIILPPALARQRPSGARLEGGALEVSFEERDERERVTA